MKLTNSELTSIVEAADYLRGIAAAWPDGPYRRWSEDLHNIAAAHVIVLDDDRAHAPAIEPDSRHWRYGMAEYETWLDALKRDLSPFAGETVDLHTTDDWSAITEGLLDDRCDEGWYLEWAGPEGSMA